jgi:protein HOOK3
MSESQLREIDAFKAFFASFELDRPVVSIADLGDGAALFDLLNLVYVSLPLPLWRAPS